MSRLRRLVFNRWSFLLGVVVVGSAQLRPPGGAGALPGLTQAQTNAFRTGSNQFATQLGANQGLGPIFNGRSCGECHPNGNGSTRIGNIIGSGTPAQFNAGGPVIQVSALNGFTPEPVPNDVPVAVRRSMTTQGLGLVGGIPDAHILAEQARQESVVPLLAGKANIVTDVVNGGTRVGRVGQKCQHPNATSFAAEAYLRENGITTPWFPNEEAPFNNPALLAGNPVPGVNNNGDNVIRFGTFMDFLAPPAPNPPRNNTVRAQITQGAAIFDSIGCSVCHKATWTTGTSSVAALSQKQLTPWSDFLLHDMGASGDQVAQGTDTNGQPIPGSWMRTTPLWGSRRNPRLWHDGSIGQADFTGAINKHDGQGAPSKAAFQVLTTTQKQALTAFLNSL